MRVTDRPTEPDDEYCGDSTPLRVPTSFDGIGLPCDFYDLLTARLVTVPVCYLSEIVKFTEFLLLGATTTDSSQVFGWLKTTL